MARQNRVHDLRNHGVVIADDAREQGIFRAQAFDQMLAHLILHRAPGQPRFREVSAAPQLTQRCGKLG